MHAYKTAILAAIVGSALAAPTALAETGRSDDLTTARGRVVAAAAKTKGSPRQTLEIERYRLDRLIGDLERGRAVDPREIDREIERANRLAP
jgi:hypothetical protein